MKSKKQNGQRLNEVWTTTTLGTGRFLLGEIGGNTTPSLYDRFNFCICKLVPTSPFINRPGTIDPKIFLRRCENSYSAIPHQFIMQNIYLAFHVAFVRFYVSHLQQPQLGQRR